MRIGAIGSGDEYGSSLSTLVLQQVKYIATAQVFNGPQISRFCPLPVLLPQLQPCVHAPSTDLPYSCLSTFSCVVPTGFGARSPSLLSKTSPCGEAHQNTDSGFAALQMSQLYHPAPDLSLAIQTKISVLLLNHSSKTVCTVTRQDLR